MPTTSPQFFRQLLGQFQDQLAPLWTVRVFSAGLSALSVALAARHLGRHDYGVYGIVVAAAALSRQLFDSRSHEFLITFMSKYADPERSDERFGVVLVALVLDIASAVLGALLIWLAGAHIARWILQSPDRAPVVAGALLILVGAGGATANALLMLDKDFVTFSKAELWSAVLSTGSILAAVLLTAGSQPLIIATAMAGAASTIIRWVYATPRLLSRCRRHGGILDAIRSLRSDRRELSAFALGNNLHATLRIVQQQAPALLVSGMAGVTEAASIVIAQRLTTKMQLFSFPVQQASYPQFAQQLARGDTRQVRSTLLRATVISAAVACPFMIAFCLAARWTLPLLAGSDFQSARGAVQLIVLAYSVGILATPAGVLLVAAKKLTLINFGVAVATAGQLIASLIWVPKLGGSGAAVGLIVYYGLLSTMVGAASRPLLRASVTHASRQASSPDAMGNCEVAH